jgi:nicotinate-nucleotide pyrophosphorylase (carboxylating)
MYHEPFNLWKDLLWAGLNEDGCPWDWTSLGIVQKNAKMIKAKVVAKSAGIWAAKSLVETVEKTFPSIQARSRFEDGADLMEGDIVVDFQGPMVELLALERTFLNLAAYTSGIATATHHLVDLAKKACPRNSPRICLTRKTLPGYRNIAIHGVRVGGGFSHRVGLAGGILIKENHIASAGGLFAAVENVKMAAPHGLKIEVEVRHISELEEAISAGADGLLLDNFEPNEVRKAVELLSKRTPKIFVEVSGGLSSSNISQYAVEGVDILSVGALTHSVKAMDLSFLVYE